MAVKFCNEQHARGESCPYTVKFEGAVLGDYERNMSDDSTFYAVVWDAAEGCVHKVVYGYTGAGGTDHNRCEVDATDEAIAAAREWAYGEVIRRGISLSEQRSLFVEKGREVEVTHGRKVARGTRGVVFWTGITTYGYTKCHRVGIELTNGERVFTDMINVEVVAPERYEVPDAEIIAQAAAFAAKANQHALANLVRVYETASGVVVA